MVVLLKRRARNAAVVTKVFKLMTDPMKRGSCDVGFCCTGALGTGISQSSTITKPSVRDWRNDGIWGWAETVHQYDSDERRLEECLQTSV